MGIGIPSREWLAVLRAAASQVAAQTLRFDERTAVPPPLDDHAGTASAYINIIGEGESIHLGLSTTPEGVRTLVRALLRVRAERALEEQDATDGLGELLNVVAGKVKSQMSGPAGVLLLGLPMVIHGRVQPAADMECAEEELMLGPVPCRIAVYRRARESRHAA